MGGQGVKNSRKSAFVKESFWIKKNIKFFDIPSIYAKIWRREKISALGDSRSGSKAKEKEEQKLVITMPSYALQRHLGWRTQAAWANLLEFQGAMCPLFYSGTNISPTEYYFHFLC